MPYTGNSHFLGKVSMVVSHFNSHNERKLYDADRFNAGKTGTGDDLEGSIPCQAAFAAGCCKTDSSTGKACKLAPSVINFTSGSHPSILLAGKAQKPVGLLSRTVQRVFVVSLQTLSLQASPLRYFSFCRKAPALQLLKIKTVSRG